MDAVNEWRTPNAAQSDRSRYYYLNSLAYNMRINNQTRKMLDMWRTEYARPWKPGRRDTRKRSGQDGDNALQRVKDDADQWVARQAARNQTPKSKTARGRRCKPACLIKLENIYADLYGGNSSVPDARRHAHDPRWKAHDHCWAKYKLEEMRNLKKEREKAAVDTPSERPQRESKSNTFLDVVKAAVRKSTH